MDDYGSHETQAAAQLLTRTVPSAGAALASSPPRLPTSRPSTANRSASTIIKQASSVAACAEVQLPSLVGTNSRVLSALLSDALGIEVDPSSVRAVETSSGVYAFVRTRPSKEKLLVALKGKQFLAPSSTELRHILDEAMLLEALRHSSDDLPASLVSKFPILGHGELYRNTDRIVFVTLVKDHLDSCFERHVKNQFQYTVQFNQLWSHLVQFHFFSLRHFTEAVEGTVEAAAAVARHPFRKWLFLFAYQAKLQSTKPEDPRLQSLCEETVSDECIAMVWEKTADASHGPESSDP